MTTSTVTTFIKIQILCEALNLNPIANWTVGILIQLPTVALSQLCC